MVFFSDPPCLVPLGQRLFERGASLRDAVFAALVHVSRLPFWLVVHPPD
jgi:hypothetical protein